MSSAQPAVKVSISITPRVVKLIDRLMEEVDGPPLFRSATKYADKAGGPPPMDELVSALRAAGYKATRTHFDHAGVRTDAPPGDIRRVVAEIAEGKKTARDSQRRDGAADST